MRKRATATGKKGKYVAFRLPVDAWSYLKTVAKANHRSMTEQLRIILGTWNVDHPDEANPDLKKIHRNQIIGQTEKGGGVSS